MAGIRIISGFAGSRTIRVPGSGTRPTSDRVREALFSALEARDVIAGAEVLDLYAGSGSLGLECASRGAAVVTLVDRGSEAAKMCRDNARIVTSAAPRGAAPRITVHAKSVGAYLSGATVRSDLVFIDPPYDLPEAELTANLAALVGLVTDDGLVLVERSSRSPEPTLPAALEVLRKSTYGETVVWWITPV